MCFATMALKLACSCVLNTAILLHPSIVKQDQPKMGFFLIAARSPGGFFSGKNSLNPTIVLVATHLVGGCLHNESTFVALAVLVASHLLGGFT